MLAAAGSHADGPLAAFQRPDHRAGDAFFVEGLGFFLLRAVR